MRKIHSSKFFREQTIRLTLRVDNVDVLSKELYLAHTCRLVYSFQTGEHGVGALITTTVSHHLLTELKPGCMLSLQSSSHSGASVQPISLQI